MRIRVLQSVAGINYSYARGDELALEGRVAYDLLSGGLAELIHDEVVEEAVVPAPEVAVKRGRGRPRRSERT